MASKPAGAVFSSRPSPAHRLPRHPSRAPAIARAQQVTTWRCQSMWSAAELTYKAFQDLCDRIKVNYATAGW